MHNGKVLVAVVGGDGTGKTSVSMGIVERLNAMGYAARYVGRWDIVGNSAYPSASFLSHDVRHIRACVADMPLPARFLFLLWSMSLALVADQPCVPENEILIVDGYWMKHAASEVAYGLTPEWALAVSSALPAPNVVLHLNVSPEEAWSRKQSDLVPYECGMDPFCSKESFLRHQECIGHFLDHWSTKFGWTKIQASLPFSQVVDNGVAQILSITPPQTLV